MSHGHDSRRQEINEILRRGMPDYHEPKHGPSPKKQFFVLLACALILIGAIALLATRGHGGGAYHFPVVGHR